MITMLVGVLATALRSIGGKSISDNTALTTFGEFPVHVHAYIHVTEAASYVFHAWLKHFFMQCMLSLSQSVFTKAVLNVAIHAHVCSYIRVARLLTTVNQGTLTKVNFDEFGDQE